MKARLIFGVLMMFVCSLSFGQTGEQRINKLELRKKERKYFNNRDSSITLYIDTLVMKDRSSLQFVGKKKVTLVVKHAEIGKRAFISGMGGRNNASDFDIDINFVKLGSLYVIARGQDAINGTTTFPNGDGGDVRLVYDSRGVTPQRADKKADHYVYVDVSAGGRTTNPTTDLNQIYSRIAMSAPGLRGVPGGQIYSGSPGQEGSVTIEEK